MWLNQYQDVRVYFTDALWLLLTLRSFMHTLRHVGRSPPGRERE